MGIRFDSSSRRATNGPVIFFSDASSEASFSEEVNGAIISGLSFYSYRQPGAPMVTFGSSEGFVEGIGIPGFVIARFDPSKPYLTIPYRGCKTECATGSDYEMPAVSTTREEYMAEVEAFKKRLAEYPDGKIVAARADLHTGSLDPGEVFFDFCRRFPQAYVFCFSTPLTGCWIGASPELLLESHNGELSTMALAGTRRTGEPGPWDAKNLREQQIVTDYILSVFEKEGLRPTAGATYSRRAGAIEHICTPVTAPLPRSFKLETLLKTLAPTPALCGRPKDMALQEILTTEKFDRGCYGGFCGPYHSDSDFSFNVVLRCASMTRQSYCVYAGGGITSQSDPSAEWTETDSKIFSLFCS